ncbi:MAG: InlB B-repeat-containing protein [Deferribacteraceae bacterium]|nr:InlB B-repeat-containing protein [Deferribacteraceae bacterium]
MNYMRAILIAMMVFLAACSSSDPSKPMDALHETKVYFHYGGGSDVVDIITVRSGRAIDPAMIPANPTNPNLDFIEWLDIDDDPFALDSEIAMETHVYGSWRATISFDSKGGTDASGRVVEYNDAIGSLPTPTKSGYSFVGWANDLGVIYNSETIVQAHTVLSAVWGHRLTFIYNDGVNDITVEVLAEDGVPIDESLIPTPTNGARVAVGWNSMADGSGVVFNKGTPIVADETYYAIWGYLVTFDSDNGADLIVLPADSGDRVSQLPAAPTKDGFVFIEWNDAGGALFDQNTIITGDTTVKAVWGYTVTFKPLNDEADTLVNAKIGSSISAVAAPTKAGTVFGGWRDTATATIYQVGDSIIVNSNMTLNAIWTVTLYYVEIDINGAVMNTPSVAVEIEKPIGTLHTPAPYPPFVFKEWNSSQDGTGSVLQPTDIIAVDTPYYTIWYGSVRNPKEIWTEADLFAMRQEIIDNPGVAAHYKLMADIDLTQNWTPSGTFTGTFDGNYYELRGLSGGLFESISGADDATEVVKNLGIVGSSASGTVNVGGIAGTLDRGVISGSYVVGGVIKGVSYVGGIVGVNRGTIKNCFTTSDIIADNYAGGIAGLMDDTTGTVATILNTYASGNITATVKSAAGLVGHYAKGVTLESSVALNKSIVSASYNNRIIAEGGVGGTSGTVGNVSNNFALDNIEICADGVAHINLAGSSITQAEAESEVTYTAAGWIFGVGSWTMPAGGGYPIFDWKKSNVVDFIDDGVLIQRQYIATGETATPPTVPDVQWSESSFVITEDTSFYAIRDGDGTAEATPKIINNAAELAAINLNGHYKLIGDIDLAGVNWTPIGTNAPFTGTFDGAGFTIRGLSVNSNNYAGLFGNIGSGAKIRNLNVDSAAIAGTANAGIIAGIVVGGLIDGCTVSGTVAGNGGATGGIAGELSNATIQNSSSNAIVSNSSPLGTGGVVGVATNSTIKATSSHNNVSGEVTVGGIVGIMDGSNVINSMFSADVICANSYCGGIVGQMLPNSAVQNNFSDDIIVTALATYGEVVGHVADGSVDGNAVRNFKGSVVGSSSGTVSQLGNITAGDFTKKSTYVGWLFGMNADKPWCMNEALGELPYLYFER